MGRREDQGFTLIELMVVVLVLGILLAIAVPTVLGLRNRANDRASQSNIQNVGMSELAYFGDFGRFTADPDELRALEPSMRYVPDIASLVEGGNRVLVEVSTTFHADDTVRIGARSKSGRCFWMRIVGDQALPRFASDNCAATSLVFGDEW